MRSELAWKLVPVSVPSSQSPLQLQALTVDAEGRMRVSQSLPLDEPFIPWQIDFQLPSSMRVAEQLIVDVTLVNHLHNCSQVRDKTVSLTILKY